MAESRVPILIAAGMLSLGRYCAVVSSMNLTAPCEYLCLRRKKSATSCVSCLAVRFPEGMTMPRTTLFVGCGAFAAFLAILGGGPSGPGSGLESYREARRVLDQGVQAMGGEEALRS